MSFVINELTINEIVPTSVQQYGSNQSASNRDGISSMTTTVVYREDHANNLRLKTCFLSYNLHVRLLFEMKKKKKKTQ